MLRFATPLLLLALVGVTPLLTPAPAPAAQRFADDISGRYVNQTNGRVCEVYARGRSFVFVNENGSRAKFVYSGPGQLEMVAGDWDPSVVVTVKRDRWGRPALRFDSFNAPPGLWVAAGW